MPKTNFHAKVTDMKFILYGYSGIQTMVKKISLPTITAFNSLLVIVTALLFCFPISAHAGTDAPSSDAPPVQDAPPIEMESYGTPVAVLYDGYLMATFFHNPHVSENKFILRLSKYGALSGCVHLQRGEGPVGTTNLSVDHTTVKYVSDRLEIMLDMPVAALSDSEPRYANHDCETSHIEVFADIPLNRDILINKNIKKFAIKLPTIDFGINDIDITKDRLIFKSNFAGQAPESWATLWFFPENTIKLYVPGANSDMNVIKEIRDFGIAHGLTPMDEVLKGYTLPHQANDYVYFVDSKQVFLRELNVTDNNKQIGEIRIAKTYKGPEGPQERIKPLPIFGNLVLEQKIMK